MKTKGEIVQFSDQAVKFYLESTATAAAVLLGIGIVLLLTVRVFRNPFRYPYFRHTFDVSNRRNVQIEDCIDIFLSDEDNWRLLQRHEQSIVKWKAKSEKFLRNCSLKNHRARQYRQRLDDDGAYCFSTSRKQTRYRQSGYVRTSYRVEISDCEMQVSWQWLQGRYSELEQIGFETTLRDYYNKSQRKLLTPALRREIKERDCYTCQICGKYMPDEVGLQIDHILPIARGGKTVPSNLRVLCSKCNGKKGAR